MKIGIIGLGFVGSVMSLVCANAISEEYAVIGVDLANEESYWKIKSINNGVFPLIADDPKIDEFFENTKLKGNFYARCSDRSLIVAVMLQSEHFGSGVILIFLKFV